LGGGRWGAKNSFTKLSIEAELTLKKQRTEKGSCSLRGMGGKGGEDENSRCADGKQTEGSLFGEKSKAINSRCDIAEKRKKKGPTRLGTFFEETEGKLKLVSSRKKKYPVKEHRVLKQTQGKESKGCRSRKHTKNKMSKMRGDQSGK